MTDSNIDVLKIYEQEKALLKGHFILSSGKHSSVYLQSAIVLSKPHYLNKIANHLVASIKKIIDVTDIDLVVSPAMGGVIIGNKIGEILDKKSIFLERVEGKFKLRRGFVINKNEKVLLVEDVITTGKSSIESVECVTNYGGKVCALSSIIDRSGKDLKFDFPFVSIIKINAPIYDNHNIPADLKNIPVLKPGSRFLK